MTTTSTPTPLVKPLRSNTPNDNNGSNNNNSNNNDNNTIVSFRGPCVENTHRIHIAIVSAHNTLTHYTGNPHRPTLLRSALKPIQALAILSTGAAPLFSLTPADTALLCASHSSEPRHITRARSILQRTGASAALLTCGGHAALNQRVARQWVESGFSPSALYSNCSGKHVGMVAGAVALGGLSEASRYALPGSRMQECVRRVVGEMGGCADEHVQWAVDGCNLPVAAMPLVGLARMFVRIAEAGDMGREEEGEEGGDIGGEPMKDTKEEQVKTDEHQVNDTNEEQVNNTEKQTKETTHNLSRIFHAMTTYPELVGGEDRFCTDLMTAYKGLLIGKVGADGCYGIGIRASSSSPSSSPPCSSSSPSSPSSSSSSPSSSPSPHPNPTPTPSHAAMGIAVKIEDGNLSILYAAIPEILEQLGVGTAEMRGQLERWRFPVMKNTAGVVVGRLEHRFKVIRVGGR